MASTYNAETNGSQVVSDLADQIKGKVILTTGVTPGGLGGTFVEAIAKAKPSLLILAGRNTANIQKAADAITAAHSDVAVRILQLDLGSLVSVREAAAQVNSWDDVPSVDVLVNNAAIMATKFSLSPEGVENQFATNHLGPFLFTNLIIEKILASKCPRIVNVGSDGHRFHPIRFDDYNFGNGEHYNEWYAYGQSKTANMLMALSLAEKLGSKRGLLAFSLHPGVILTNLAGHIDFSVSGANLAAADKTFGNREMKSELVWKTSDQGIATHVYAAFDPSLKDNNGAYLQDAHVADPWTQTVKAWGTSPVEAEMLWKLSEKLVGQVFDY